MAAMSTPAPDHFSLFGLEPRFGLDSDHLNRAYRTVQAHVHPDRYAAAGAAEQRAALQWATLANEAYQVLSSPVRRAAYLCGRHGVPVTGEAGGAVPAEFLELQLEWRQALDEIRHEPDPQRLDELRGKAVALHQLELGQLESKIDLEHDFVGAADAVRRLMFVDKFIKELEASGEAAQPSTAS
ncbi:MAG TPA: Fe-S protein assembly co-chaperone HscB [Burkholderiaceae bacterium]|jgi:molecular chaperone HscB|nr:Fe-S protein assembly co-chaperone HscB [Burkholderiaceae bacterium]